MEVEAAVVVAVEEAAEVEEEGEEGEAETGVAKTLLALCSIDMTVVAVVVPQLRIPVETWRIYCTASIISPMARTRICTTRGTNSMCRFPTQSRLCTSKVIPMLHHPDYRFEFLLLP